MIEKLSFDFLDLLSCYGCMKATHMVYEALEASFAFNQTRCTNWTVSILAWIDPVFSF
jgi:hypothetical protein